MKKAIERLAVGAMVLVSAANFVACSANDDDNAVCGIEHDSQVVSFSIDGDGFKVTTEQGAQGSEEFGIHDETGNVEQLAKGNAVTRAGLTANGKALTDLWVFDFVDGKQVQSKHLGSDDDLSDFSLKMEQGDHTLYFVASRGTDAVVDSAAHSITWGKCSDMFYKAFSLSVSKATGTQTVTLARVASRLMVTVKDAIPEDMSKLLVTPTDWYVGFDYVNGSAVENAANKAITTDIPASLVGKENIYISLFAIGGDWKTDAVIDAQDKDGKSLGTANVSGVKMKQNVTNNCTGYMFSGKANAAFSLAVSDEWETVETEW